MKGCGKEVKWSWQTFLCGEMEDLKHSDHIILCPECKEKFAKNVKDEVKK